MIEIYDTWQINMYLSATRPYHYHLPELMVQKCGTNCHWKLEKLMMQSALKTLWRAILWNHTPDSYPDIKFHETCSNIMWPGNNSSIPNIRGMWNGKPLIMNWPSPIWICMFPGGLTMIANTQARSQITHIARRTPAMAGPSDEWLIWAPSQYKDRLIYVWRFPC